MSIRKVNLINNEYYHLFNRGNSKQKIFHDNEDYIATTIGQIKAKGPDSYIVKFDNPPEFNSVFDKSLKYKTVGLLER